VRGSTLGRIVLVYLPDSNSFRQVDPLCVERDRGFADSLLEEGGFEPSVPLLRKALLAFLIGRPSFRFDIAMIA
jgi:hypothetical protein